jgi:hypothetical protein
VIPGKNLLRPKPSIMGIFVHPDDLLTAVTAVKDLNQDFTVFAPSALEPIQAAMKQKPSPVRYYTFFGGLLGLISGFSLAVYTVIQWKFIVSGKPIVPWIPFVIVGFEFLILFGVLLSFAGMLIHSRLPRLALPAYYDPRFSDDRFGLLIACSQNEREKIAGLLKEFGAEEIHDIVG